MRSFMPVQLLMPVRVVLWQIAAAVVTPLPPAAPRAPQVDPVVLLNTQASLTHANNEIVFLKRQVLGVACS